jgi:hypothetical protein
MIKMLDSWLTVVGFIVMIVLLIKANETYYK